MPIRIQDGTGRSYETKVDSSNRLITKSDVVDVEMSAVEREASFALYGKCLLAVTTAKSGLIYLKNTSSNLSIHPTRIFMNAEDIGTNKAIIEFRKNPVIDTSNAGDSISAVNKSFSSAKDADISAAIASSTDLEFSSLGTLFHRMTISADTNMLMDFKGSVRLNQNNIFGIRWIAAAGGNPTNAKAINFTINFVVEEI